METTAGVGVIVRAGGIGADRAIDCVGVGAQHAHHGSGAKAAKEHAKEFEQERAGRAGAESQGHNRHPGDAPSQALRWGVEALAKAGTHAIIGVYPETVQAYPIGMAMNRNLTLRMGNCNHRKYIPMLVELVRSGGVDPTAILTQVEAMTDVIGAYVQFDARRPGWIKVELRPGA